MVRQHHYQFLFLLFLFVSVTADDEAVMTALLSGLSSPPSNWSGSTPYCQWTGVTCDKSKRVTAINLDNMSLLGTLPADLNKLSNLQILLVRNNAFSGALPSLSGLASLQEAFLDDNRFDSAPPSFLKGLTGLQFLGLSDNHNLPPWSIPTDLTESPSLTIFNAANASLTGSLPDIFGSFPYLRDVNLSRNNLTGHIPRSLTTIDLYSLDLSYNNLTGPIPSLHKIENPNLSNNTFLGASSSGSSKSIGLIAGVVIILLTMREVI